MVSDNFMKEINRIANEVLNQLSEVLVFPSIQDARGDMEGFGKIRKQRIVTGLPAIIEYRELIKK